jgi:predicted nicotinamide N-methyase
MSGYLIRQQRVRVTGVAALNIRSLLDRQQFSDPLGAAAAVGISSAAWPMFGLLWPSGVHLAAAVARRPLLADESILEIGCGLALASLVSHRRGALVTASDSHPLAGGFLLENLKLNGLPPLRYCHGNWSSNGMPHAPPPTALAQGQRPRLQGRFDLIIGSDVLYERDEAGTLAAFISRHARSVSEVMIVDPNRGNRPVFNRHMAALGYALEDVAIKSLPGASVAYSGRLLHYRRT